MIDLNNNITPLEDITKYPGWVGNVTSKGEIDPYLVGKVTYTYTLCMIKDKYYLSYVTPNQEQIKHFWFNYSPKGDPWMHKNAMLVYGKNLEEFILKAMKCGERKPIPVQLS